MPLKCVVTQQVVYLKRITQPIRRVLESPQLLVGETITVHAQKRFGNVTRAPTKRRSPVLMTASPIELSVTWARSFSRNSASA